MSVVIAILLIAAVALTVLCSLGVLLMRDAFSRLHFSSPITSLAPALIAVAVWLNDTDWQARIKVLLIALILFMMNAILSHSTARAIHIQRLGHWERRPEDPPLAQEERP